MVIVTAADAGKATVESPVIDLRLVFVPNWLDPRDDYVCISDDNDRRTPHFPSAPTHVLNFVTSTYNAKSASPSQGEGDTPCQTFTRFSELPSELRLDIWELALPGSRVVELLYNTTNGRPCYSRCPPPIHLSVNKEARQVALKRYKLSFATSTTPPNVYVNMEIDQIYIGAGNFSAARGELHTPTGFFNKLLPEDRSSIKHLIIDEMFCRYFVSKEDDPDVTERYGLVNLKSMTMVDEDDEIDTIFCPAKEQQGEYHVWSLCTQGRATPHFVDEEENFLDGDPSIFAFWSSIEEIVAEDPSDPISKLTHIRLVSRPRLKRQNRWKARIGFLDETTFSYERSPCLFRKDGVIDRLVDIEFNAATNGTEEYEDFQWELCMGEVSTLDPILIYAGNNPCVCPVGHVWEPDDGRPEIANKFTLNDFKLALDYHASERQHLG
ncbi:hypothetical protein IFR05_005770 [Cadophora sp. M221]|nr:hypothetical protein IFR05_005770 [Cadophora sp. M221]